MKFLIFLSTLLTLALIIVGQHIAPGSCPADREVAQDFNLNEYTGRWYEIQRYDQPYEKDGDCAYAIYTLNGAVPNSINIQNTMRKLPDGKRTVTTGFGVLSYSVEHPEAKLNVTFRPNEPANRSNYWILSTDYTGFAIIYGCRTLNETHMAESAWVLSRTPSLSDDSKEMVDSIIDKYFDVLELRVTVQNTDECRY